MQENITSDYRATFISIISLFRSLSSSVVYLFLGGILELFPLKIIFLLIFAIHTIFAIGLIPLYIKIEDTHKIE